MAAEELLSTIKKQASTIPVPNTASIKSTSAALPSLNTSSIPNTAEHPIGPQTPQPTPPQNQEAIAPSQNMAGQKVTNQYTGSNGYTMQDASAGGTSITKPQTPPIANIPNTSAPTGLESTPTPTIANSDTPTPSSVATSATTKPAAPNNSALPSATADIFNQVQQDASGIDGQIDDLKKADVASQGQLTDQLVQAATDKYATEQANNDRLQATQDKILADRNAAVNANSDQARLDAQNAYDANEANLKVQQMRTQQADQDRILEQQKQNKLSELNDETRLAAMGGYGTQQGYTQMTNETLQNDRVLNSLTLQADANDLDYANKFNQTTNDYQAALSGIATTKQNAIQDNYDKYLDYVTNISNNREMGANEKATAIATAKADYTDKVSQINHDSFNDKYTKTWDMANKAQDLLKSRRDDARTVMTDMLNRYAMSDQDLTPEQTKQLATLEQQAGYPIGSSASGIAALKEQAKRNNLDMQNYTDDQGNVTYATVNKLTGQIVNSFTLKGASKTAIGKYQTSYNSITGETTSWDSSTGQMGAVQGPLMNYVNNGGDPSTGVPGLNKVDQRAIDPTAYNKIFEVGQKGGQCGTFASTISTAPKVGNTYNEKIDKVDSHTPKVGDKIVLPLGLSGKKFDPSTDPGHIAVVTSFDPSTGDIGVVESNKHLDGMVSTGTYNLNTLNGKYGADDWGFITGDLKPDIQQQLLQTPDFQDTNKLIAAGTNQKGQLSIEDVSKAFVAAGQQDKIAAPADLIKALLAARMSNGASLPKSMQDLPSPEEYAANPSKYANLTPDQLATVSSKAAAIKATNPSSSLNFDPATARSNLKAEPAVQVYDSIKPLTGAINQLNSQANDPSGIQNGQAFDTSVQTVLGEITKQGATKANGGGIPDSQFNQLQEMIDQVSQGRSLSDDQRTAALKVINTFNDSYTNQVKGLVNDYAAQATRKGADPRDVVLGYDDLYSPSSDNVKVKGPDGKTYLMSSDDAKQAVQAGGTLIN